ncbi:MAG: Gfo/Idh/MocA family oxidoreductase [Phycisphaerales bacterium]|nr:Gfo/Idh/MocA family oxidoreductase [Phycisphaerales bacterium]
MDSTRSGSVNLDSISGSMSRRRFLRHAALVGAAGSAAALATTGALAMPGSRRPGLADTRLRVLSIGVVGTIGEADRKAVASHPRAEIVGLCDVDAEAMGKAVKDHPQAFKCEDYREAFDRHGDRFDAVIVATPDHSHCAIMTLALSKGKHVYGQKPLVQQLEELELLGRAVKASPRLVTQTGAQRIEHAPRRAAVDILKSGGLGKVIEVHIAFGGSALAGGHYFADGRLGEPIEPPKGFNYDLWLNGAQHEPCRPQMVQRQWRSWWKYGGGQIADWVVHLTDVVFYAFPELTSPVRVCSRTPSRDLSNFHARRVSSTLTYNTIHSPEKFANSTCNFYFYDSGMMPDREQIGLGKKEGDNNGWPSGIVTVVVCEGGTLVLAPEGPLEIWREGKMTDGMQWPGLPKYEKFNHWHAWVDKALGIDTPHRWMPFEIGLRCTEPGLLAVKAAKFPGMELDWGGGSFTNSARASETLVRRPGGYRKGFEPVRVGV